MSLRYSQHVFKCNPTCTSDLEHICNTNGFRGPSAGMSIRYLLQHHISWRLFYWKPSLYIKHYVPFILCHMLKLLCMWRWLKVQLSRHFRTHPQSPLLFIVKIQRLLLFILHSKAIGLYKQGIRLCCVLFVIYLSDWMQQWYMANIQAIVKFNIFWIFHLPFTVSRFQFRSF